MREIKFRAWWKHPEYNPNGEMYFVGGLMFATKQEGEPEYDDCNTPKEVGLMKRVNDYKMGWNDSKECVLMQYTGLKDKNGKEIYEGDIMAMSHTPDNAKGYVIFDRGAYRLIRFKSVKTEWLNNTYLRLYTKRHIVVGNIYENPDLLK